LLLLEMVNLKTNSSGILVVMCSGQNCSCLLKPLMLNEAALLFYLA